MTLSKKKKKQIVLAIGYPCFDSGSVTIFDCNDRPKEMNRGRVDGDLEYILILEEI